MQSPCLAALALNLGKSGSPGNSFSRIEHTSDKTSAVTAKGQQYKSQHYNPVVYLREFASNKKKELWEFDLTQSTAKQSTPKDCGCEDFYHSVALENGERDHVTIEKAFGPFESRLPELFKAIRNPTKPLCHEFWRVFFTFTAIQYSRSPKNVRKAHDFLSEIHQTGFEILCAHSTDLKKRLTEQGVDPLKAQVEFEMQASQGSALLPLLQTVECVTNVFANMKWSFLYAPTSSFFVTSDKPVCCWLPADRRSIFGVALTDPDVEITFPLSRKVCAFGCRESPYPQPYHSASGEIVDSFNVSTAMNGWRFVYGPSNDLKIVNAVQEVAKSRNGRLPAG